MALVDDINAALRDFQRYTGDGLPNAPSGKPLPIGDPSTGVFNPSKATLRSLLINIAQTMGDPSALQDILDDLGTKASADDLTAVESDVAAINAEIDKTIVSAAPVVLADTDSDGYARFVLRADGRMQSNVDLIHSGNEVDIPNVKFAETDAEGRAVRAQLSDGSFLEANPAPPMGRVGDVHLLLVDGQSPFVASATTATSTTPATGLKMFNVGVTPTSTQFSSPSSWTSFVPHVESGNESSARGMAEGVLSGASASGRPLTAADIVSVVTAVGGQSVRDLVPGGAYWHYKTVAIDRWAAVCAAQGKIPGQVFWGVWQGEADTSLPIGGAAWAAKWEAGRVALEEYIESALGWRVEVVQVHMQTAANFYYNKPLPLISEATNLAVEYPRIFLGGATYDFDYGGADGVGSHLSTAADAFHAGWRCGFAIGKCWSGAAPERIVATAATKLTSTMVRVDYGGGYEPPLTLSTAIVSDPGNYGFEIGYHTDSGFTALEIDSVTVAGGAAVIIRTVASLPDEVLVVRYGYIGGQLDDADADPFGSFSGRLTGARGCLQADTGRTFTFNGVTVSDILRPTIHSITLR